MTNSEKIYRLKDDYIIAGICSGLAKHFNIDPTIVRLIFILLSLGGGSGILIYLILWFVVPKEEGKEKEINHEEKVREFKASILVIDANGIGSGVVDQLVLDLNDGNPPYKVMNDIDNQWTKYQTPDAIPMVYALKAQRKETKNSDMINNIMKVFNKLDIELLKTSYEGIKELEKKNKKKFRDDSEEMACAEIPYILTSNLCDEIMNLLYKQRGNDSDIEQISRSIPKDKFSALMYGLFWIYLEEKKNKEHKRNNNIDINKLFLFKQPNIRKY